MNVIGGFLVVFGLWIAIGLGYSESWSGVCCQWYPLTVAIGLVIAGFGALLLVPPGGNTSMTRNEIAPHFSNNSGQTMNNKPSEMKCLCNRCEKIWYLDSNEIEDLQNRFQAVQGYNKSGFNISMLTALFDPKLSAQMTTSSVVASQSILSLKKEIEEKTTCPNCNSKDITREIVEMGVKMDVDKTSEEETETDNSGNLAKLKDLKELYDEGLIDGAEFKQMKKEILE